MSTWSRGAAISGLLAPGADELGVGLARALGGLVGGQVGDAEQEVLQLGVERLLLVVGGRDDGLQLAGALDQRGPLLGARALHRLGHALGLRARLVAALDRRVAPGEQLLQRGDVQGVAPAGQLADGVGGGIEQDAGVVHPSRVSAGGERVSAPVRGWPPPVAGCPADPGRARPPRRMWRPARDRRTRRPPPCPVPNPLPPPPSRPTPPARPTSRCSATPSATTSTARSPPSPTTRRWSTCPAGAAGRTRRCARTSTRWRSACSPRASGRATGSGSGRPTSRSGRSCSTPPRRSASILVNINPAYRTHELEYVLNQAGIALLVAAPSFKTSDYAAMIEEVRPNCPALREVVLLGTPGLGRARRGGQARRPRRARPPAGRAVARRPDQHPVHVGHHGLPQGRHALAPQHPQQRLLRRSALRLHPDDRVCIPVPFYHCFGMVMGNLGVHDQRRDDGHPRPRVRPEGHPGGRRSRSGAPRCTACRRCSSPSSTTRTSSPTTCRRCAPGSWRARRARWR